MYQDGYSCTRNFHQRRPSAIPNAVDQLRGDAEEGMPLQEHRVRNDDVAVLPQQVNVNFDLPHPLDNHFNGFNPFPAINLNQPSASQEGALNENFILESVNHPLMAHDNYNNNVFAHQPVRPNESFHQLPLSQASLPNEFDQYQPVNLSDNPP